MPKMNAHQKRQITILHDLLERNVKTLLSNTLARKPVESISESYVEHLNVILNDIKKLLEGEAGLRYLENIPKKNTPKASSDGRGVTVLEVILILNDYIALLNPHVNNSKG